MKELVTDWPWLLKKKKGINGALSTDELYSDYQVLAYQVLAFG